MLQAIHKNKIIIGIITGIILPTLAYIIIITIRKQINSLPSEVDPYQASMIFERVSIFANLLGFYYFLHKGHYQTVRGIVIMTFMLALAYAIFYFNK